MDTRRQTLTFEVPLALTPVRFSLILATVGRTVELSKFLLHLERQSYRNFELIVVDQNPDDRLIPILAPYSDRLTVKHLRSKKGLSRARNVGLHSVSGDVVAFPDDDCWYAPTTLERVAGFFCEHPDWNGITGRVNAKNTFPFLDGKDGFLNRVNVWHRATSITIFLRVEVVRMVGDFDPLLGAGSESGLGCAEEIDYLLRALEKKYRIYYRSDLLIDHPDELVYDDRLLQKGYSDSRAAGYTLRKHQFPFWFVSYRMLRALGGAALSFGRYNLPKARYHWAIFRGRLSGWLG